MESRRILELDDVVKSRPTKIPGKVRDLPDNQQWSRRMDIKSIHSGNVYRVAQNKNTGQWGCSCPAWTRSAARDCKHLRELEPVLRGIEQGFTDGVKGRTLKTVRILELD